MNHFVAVIMAGGAGQRFWPLSTADRPKQFLDLEKCGRSLLQSTLDRLLPLVDTPEQIFVITGERYRELVLEQLPQLPQENLLLEPTGRDTAPAVALAALELRALLGNPIMGIFPSDHRVGNVPVFQETMKRAIRLTQETDGLFTLGMQPNRPATGYGYIERGEAIPGGYKVARFVEKPDKVRAQQYVQAGRYSWNGGIFLWKVETILSELARYAPDLLLPLARAHQTGSVSSIFPTLPKISIDYAVMERTQRAYVIPAEFAWDDIGDWEALERLLRRNERDANTVVGHHVGLEASGNIIYTQDEDSIIVMLGVENLVIVKRGNAVLLVHKERVQDIKKLLQDDRVASFALI